jgi:hypothetical protein
MKLKPYLMKYQCPHIAKWASSPNTPKAENSCPAPDANKPLSRRPPLPARSGDGSHSTELSLFWHYSFYVVPFAIFPETLLLAAFILMPEAIAISFLLYFWRSQRVKKNFTT